MTTAVPSRCNSTNSQSSRLARPGSTFPVGRQFDAEERQLDRLLEKEIGVRHCARSDREIEENEQIGEPQAPANRCRVVDRLLDRLQIVGLGRDWRKVRRGGRSSPLKASLGRRCYALAAL